MMVWHFIEPRVVVTAQAGSEGACVGVMLVTGVLVCRFTPRVTAPSSIWVMSLYGHSRAALYVRHDFDPLIPETCDLH